VNEIENRLIRLFRTDQGKTSLCFRYGDLCSLDTIQVDVAAEKKGKQYHLEYNNNKKKGHFYILQVLLYDTSNMKLQVW
jgi:hypothetical protein